MRSVSYVSSARGLWAQPQLDELLLSVRAWNGPRELTGMLLYSGGNFMQTIEGPDAAIAEVLARISADPRHHGLMVLLDEDVSRRSFPDWTMGYRRVDVDDTSLEGYSDFLRKPTTSRLPDDASSQQSLLHTFRSLIR